MCLSYENEKYTTETVQTQWKMTKFRVNFFFLKKQFLLIFWNVEDLLQKAYKITFKSFVQFEIKSPDWQQK